MSRSTAVTEMRSGAASAGGAGAGRSTGCGGPGSSSARVNRSSVTSRGRPPLIASSRSRKRDATVGDRLSRRARVISTSGAPERAREIVRGKPDPEFERRHAELGADLGRQPRIGRGQRRPDAFVQSAEDDQVGALQPRFEQAPDEDARMTAVGRPHGARVEQLAQQRHGVVGADDRARAAASEPGARASSSAAIRPAGPRHAASPASAWRGLGKAAGEARQRRSARASMPSMRRQRDRATAAHSRSALFARTARRARRARPAAAARAA